MLLNPADRAENLTEYFPQGNRFGVEVTRILSELRTEASTLSLIGESNKVIVVTNPAELYGTQTGGGGTGASKKNGPKGRTAGKASKDPPYLKWLEQGLPETGSSILFLAFEDEAEGREINERHPLFELVARIGYPRRFRDEKAFFQIENALLQRDVSACLGAIAELWSPKKGDIMVYNSVVRCLRFMLQANIGRERKVAGDTEKQALYFPASPSLSLYKAKDFIQKRYLTGPVVYRTADLLRAYERLPDVYRALRPRLGDLHVADAKMLLERILMELFAAGGRN